MEKKNRLSYSQIKLYSECGKKYEYYYRDNIREISKSGALLFGIALNNICDEILVDKKNNNLKTLEEYNSSFDKYWEKGEINGVVLNITKSPLVGYSASDFDVEVLLPEDVALFNEPIIQLQKDLASKKKQVDKGYRSYYPGELETLNYLNWLSLRRKGHLMIKSFVSDILPKIKEIKAIQKEIGLSNDVGDVVVGYLDLHCIWEDGREVIFDFKTSSQEYDKDEVLLSQQLAIYCHAMKVNTGGYIVFLKKIDKVRTKVCSVCLFNGDESRHKTCNNIIDNKRCNGAWDEKVVLKALTQVLIDDIPNRTEEIVLENLDGANEGIKKNIFTRNFSNCYNKYGRCPYLYLCFKNSMDNLIKIEKK